MGNLESKAAAGGGEEADARSLVGRKFVLRDKRTICEVDRILARGGFSTVYSCNANKIALKQVLITEPEAEMEAMNEIRAHKHLGNDNAKLVAPLFEVQVISTQQQQQRKQKQILLFFPLFSLGSLGDMLVTRQKRPVHAGLLQSCANAVAFIHSKSLAHCDIKTINFMLSADDQQQQRHPSTVLIDFGSSRLGLHVDIKSRADAQNEQERAERMSSAAYRAPELWDVPSSCCKLDLASADVFALGCVFYACLYEPFGFTPFEHPVQGLLPLAARTATVPRFNKEEEDLSRMDLLVRSMLHKDAAQRPSAEQVVRELVEIQEEDFEANF